MRAEPRLWLRRCVTAILTALLFASLCLTASAASATEKPAASPEPTPAASPAETPLKEKESGTLPVYIDGLLFGRARVKDGAVFIAPECVCRFLGYSMEWTADAEKLRVKVQAVELRADAGTGYMTADGRCLYEPEGWLAEGGELYLPLDAIERLFGLSIEEKASPSRIEIAAKKAAIIAGGEAYYELSYPMEDLFWLAQVIHSEAYQQPLAGQIGVGNVVLNRVASDRFPNSVFDVVFDIEGVVQFEPVSTGGIYTPPDETAQIAARLCLEGYNTVGDSLYFVNPSKGSYWFDETLELVTAIGDHNFYR